MKKTCVESCLLYLKYSRTEYETRKYLKSLEYDNNEIDNAIEYCKELGYIDDEDYVNAFVSDHVIFYKWGPDKIKFKLKEKGITDKIVEYSIMDNKEDIEKNILEQTAKKARGLDLNDYKTKRKVINFLISKGYRYDDANSAFEKYKDSMTNE